MANVVVLGAGLAGLSTARDLVAGGANLMAVDPRHGTHAPPLHVCGSDQWVAGYMEGAVRTGRAAARVALEA